MNTSMSAVSLHLVIFLALLLDIVKRKGFLFQDCRSVVSHMGTETDIYIYCQTVSPPALDLPLYAKETVNMLRYLSIYLSIYLIFSLNIGEHVLQRKDQHSYYCVLTTVTLLDRLTTNSDSLQSFPHLELCPKCFLSSCNRRNFY